MTGGQVTSFSSLPACADQSRGGLEGLLQGLHHKPPQDDSCGSADVHILRDAVAEDEEDGSRAEEAR